MVCDVSCWSACHAIIQLGTTYSSIYSCTGLALCQELCVSSGGESSSYTNAS